MEGTTYIASPLGPVVIQSSGEVISLVEFLKEGEPMAEVPGNELCNLAALQLKEYFDGKRLDFDFPYRQSGTDFQQRVWKQLGKISFGKTISYLTLARELEDEKCIRAAASANGKNKLAIVVPCHRVIGSNGSLVGYAGGLWRKKWLLEHEMKVTGISVQQSLF